MESPVFRSGLRRLLYPNVSAAFHTPDENDELLAGLLKRLGLTPADCQAIPWGRRTFNGRFVDVASGEVVVEEVDVEIPGPVPFRWQRLYRSYKPEAGSVGGGWRHAYDFALLENQASGRVVVRLPDNRGLIFPFLAKGEQYLHRTEKLQLSYDGIGYRLRDSNGLCYHFAGQPGNDMYRLVTVNYPYFSHYIRFSYTRTGHLWRIQDSFQRVIDVTTNAQGNITRLSITTPDQPANALTLVTYGYDEAHQLTDVLVEGRRLAQYSYRQHRLVRLADRFGQYTFVGYKQIDNLYRCNTLTWSNSPVSLHFDYRPDEGRTLVTDSADPLRQYIHEGGIIQRVIRESGEQRVWLYNEYGELLSEQDALGNTTFYAYDPQGRTTEITWPDGGQMRMSYNNDGQLIELTDRANGIWQWVYTETGQIQTCLNPVGAQTQFSYAKDGLLQERNGIKEGRTQWEYDAYGNPSVATTEFDRKTVWSFNALGQLIRQPPVENSAQQPVPATDLKAASPYLPTYTNDGKLVALRSSDKLSWQFIRDAAGRVRDYRRPDGRSTRFHYDAAGRMTEVLFSDGSWHYYTYRPDGWLMEARTPATRIQFERDPLGKIVTETADTIQVKTVYDQAGNRTGMQSSAQAIAAYNYDNHRLLTGQQHGPGQLSYSHDRQGRLAECLMPGSLRSRWQYDQGPLPASHQLFWGSRLQAARSQTYRWQHHQLARLQDSRFGSATLVYDATNEPIEAIGSAGWVDRWIPQRARYQHGLLKPANRVSNVGWQLIQAGPTRFHYDPDGYLREKQTAGKVWQFRWHESGCLQEIIGPDASVVTFAYDALGRRIEKKCNDYQVTWAWDANRLLHEWHERTGSEPIQLTWYTAQGAATAMLQVGENQYSVVCNYLGQPLSMHDGQGNPVWEWGWCLFGKKRSLTGPRPDHTFLGYGQFEDQEVGLVYNHFRYYDRETGLPLSPEYSSPAGWVQSGWGPPHAPESFLSAARYIRAY